MKYTFDELLGLVDSRGYTIDEHCRDGNGYPNISMDRPITGFGTWEELEDFCDVLNEAAGQDVATPTHFHRRDGWYSTFWYADSRADGPYTPDDYLNDLGDNYSYPDELDIIGERLRELARDFDGDFKELEDYISYQKEIMEEVAKAGDDNQVIVGPDGYYETVPKTMLGYYHDTYTYEIGVILEYFESDTSEEE